MRLHIETKKENIAIDAVENEINEIQSSIEEMSRTRNELFIQLQRMRIEQEKIDQERKKQNIRDIQSWKANNPLRWL